MVSTTTTTAHPLLDDPPAEPEISVVRGSRRDIDWRQPLAYVALALSLVSFLVGWFQIANTEQEWEQLPYLASAGGIGVVMLGVGLALSVSIEHTRDREAVGELVREIRALKSQIDALGASDA
jgi:hypothetical protein